jgi:hypothetical protein
MSRTCRHISEAAHPSPRPPPVLTDSESRSSESSKPSSLLKRRHRQPRPLQLLPVVLGGLLQTIAWPEAWMTLAISMPRSNETPGDYSETVASACAELPEQPVT